MSRDSPSQPERSFLSETRRIIGDRPDSRWLTVRREGKDQGYSLGELGDRISDYLDAYRTEGVQPGDLVLIVMEHSLDLFASFFAGIIAGALPAFYAYPSAKQSREAFAESVVALRRHNEVRLLVGLDVVSDLPRLERAPSGGSSALWKIEQAPQESFLQFSSGTTGAKKGVRISAQALFNQIDAYAPVAGVSSESRVVSWLPHYHDMGLIACMMLPFLKRVPLLMMSPFEWVRQPEMLFEAVDDFGGTHVWLPNFALGHMNRLMGAAPPPTPKSLERVILCSEPALPDTVSRFVEAFELPERSIANCYAMAENTFAMTSTADEGISYLSVDTDAFQSGGKVVPRAVGRRIASAGRPIEGVDVRIVGPDSLQRLWGDQVGEIAIKSDCLADGYHNSPEETQSTFVDGWLRTGDLGFMHEGELYVAGRRKDMIIVGGENIFPEDIEAILNETQGIVPGRNLAFGVDDPRVGTERVVVLAELVGGGTVPDTLEIRERILGAVGVAAGEILFLPHRTLKKGTAGKISRAMNRELYLEGAFTDAAVSSPAPGADSAPSVRALVEGLVPPDVRAILSPDTELLKAGLIDSFGFAELLTAVERAYGIQVPDAMRSSEWFGSIASIERAVELLRSGDSQEQSFGGPSEAWRESLSRMLDRSAPGPAKGPLMERLINAWPLRGNMWFRLLFRLAGIQIGKGVIFLGRPKLKLRGLPKHIVLGDGVTLADGVDLRIRENGRIVLGERVYLDRGVRLVAAREGSIVLETGAEIGAFSIVNSGGSTRVGRFTMIAGNVNINSSSHGTSPDALVREQPHEHGTVEIGDDVWIGAGGSVVMGARIGDGAVVAGNSLVSGEMPAFSVSAGVPAKVIRRR